ncbi:MAG: response regulator [Planctomycetota bacterium]|nr:response regulator [Planctomycetota bacterium]
MSAFLNGSVLVVDDDEVTRLTIMDLLAELGCKVRGSANGQECLREVEANPPDIVVLDIEMPHLDGVSCCKRLKADPKTRRIPVVLVTGLDSLEDRLRGLDAGADDYLTKPIQMPELLARVRNLLRVKLANENLESAEDVIFTLARAIEAKDQYTQGHTERVTAYAVALGQAVGLDEHALHGLRQGGILHDLGKIGVPDHILNKPGKLTNEEFDIIKKHPAIGCEICRPLKSLAHAMPCIRWHHERPNGRGYPDRLSGTDIPQVARIMAVADVFDALTSRRPYKEPFSQAESCGILAKMGADGDLDPDLVALFLGLLNGQSLRILDAP